MLVLTSTTQIRAIQWNDLRGGHRWHGRDYQTHTHIDTTEIRSFWIFSATRLRVPHILLTRALTVACRAAGHVLSSTIFFLLADEQVDFYLVPRRHGVRLGFSYICVNDVHTRVILIDVLFRLAQASGLQFCCMALEDQTVAARHWPASSFESFNTRWARCNAPSYVVVLDYMADTIVIVFGLQVAALDYRGGAPRVRPADIEGHMLEPRKRLRRIVLALDSHFHIPEVLFVERHLGEADITAFLPEHFASHESWITARIANWEWSVVVNAPALSPRVWDHWLELVDQVLGRKSQLYLGYRATRRYGILVRSFEMRDFLGRINAWVSTWVPHTFTWNALGLIRHKDIHEHVDRHNARTSIAVALSTCGVWLRVRSSLSRTMVSVSMKRRPVLFDPTMVHAATAKTEATSLVLYCTSRIPRAEHLPELMQMGFRYHAPEDVPLAQVESSSSDFGPDTDRDPVSSTVPASPLDYDDEEPGVEIEPLEPDDVETAVGDEQHENSEDDVPLTWLTNAVPPPTRSRSPRRFVHPVSPTLPFVEDDDVLVASLRGGYRVLVVVMSFPCDCRGGGKKAAPQARLTWEGSSAASMLAVQSPLRSAEGVQLKQLHSAELCKDVEGFALVNWTSWTQMMKITSTGSLLFILPGHRTFETDKPEDAK
eukprot:954375-Amphidinium_carterae.2